jgi:hypothetical protein
MPYDAENEVLATMFLQFRTRSINHIVLIGRAAVTSRCASPNLDFDVKNCNFSHVFTANAPAPSFRGAAALAVFSEGARVTTQDSEVISPIHEVRGLGAGTR